MVQDNVTDVILIHILKSVFLQGKGVEAWLDNNEIRIMLSRCNL